MNEKNTKHILSIMVDNEPGVLARVIGMFSGRGYNIDSLNVAEVSNDENISRITIVTHGTSEVVNQIEKQLLRIVPVHSVTNLDQEGSSVEAEVHLCVSNCTHVVICTAVGQICRIVTKCIAGT